MFCLLYINGSIDHNIQGYMPEQRDCELIAVSRCTIAYDSYTYEPRNMSSGSTTKFEGFSFISILCS